MKISKPATHQSTNAFYLHYFSGTKCIHPGEIALEQRIHWLPSAWEKTVSKKNFKTFGI